MNEEFLLQKIFSINKKYENIAEITGENFNIFRILKMESREVRTHSAFLAELLNPKGSHGQETIFLKLFIQVFNIEKFKKSDLSNASVKVESTCGDLGRIDVLIKIPNGGEIVIENKIYAGDRKSQLLRYKDFYPDCHLLYLTLDGKKPDDSSIKEGYRELELEKDYFLLSYKEGILTWLQECRKEAVNHSLLRESLTQYINLIKYLTHQTMNEQNKDEIVDMVLKSSENIESAENIAKNWENVKLKIIDNLKKKIIEDNFAKEFGLIVDFEKNIQLGKKNSAFWFLKENWKNYLYFEFTGNDYEEILFGVVCENESNQEIPLLKAILNEKLAIANVGERIENKNWLWVSRFYAWEGTPWKNVESNIPSRIKEIIAKMINTLNEINS